MWFWCVFALNVLLWAWFVVAGQSTARKESSSKWPVPCGISSCTQPVHAVRRQLGRDVTARLVTALVLSRLDYCNAVLAGLPASTLAPFQRVLHAEARTVLDLKPRDRVTPALQELHWLPVAERIQYKLFLLVTSGTHAGIHLGLSDIGCQYSRSIYTARFVVWQPRRAADTSTNWQQSLFCCCTASMEQAADGQVTSRKVAD